MNKPIPDPVYPCAVCYADCTWPAADLFWSEQRHEWICDLCWEEAHWVSVDHAIPEFGVCLADEIKALEQE